MDLEYQSTFTAFKFTHLYQKLDKDIIFLPFNIHEIWAKKILVDNFAVVPAGRTGEVKVQRYLPFDQPRRDSKKTGFIKVSERDANGKLIRESNLGIDYGSDKTVHFVILGMNQMGTALGMEVALMAHFPNFQRDRYNRTTITFIDDHAIEEGEYLKGRFASLFDLCRYRFIDSSKTVLIYDRDKCHKAVNHVNDDNSYFADPLINGRYRHLCDKDKDELKDGNFMDIQWEFVQGNIASESIQNYISQIAEDKNNVTTIAVCFNRPQQAIASTLYLPSIVFRNAVQVLVYQKNNFDLVETISGGEKEWKRYHNVYPFGMVEGCYTEDIFDKPLAKVENYIYSYLKSHTELPKDFCNQQLLSEVDRYWDNLGIVQKLANIDMVETIPIKLRSMGIEYSGYAKEISEELKSNKNVKAWTETEHQRWMVQRLLLGYRPLDDFDEDNEEMYTSGWSYFKSHSKKYTQSWKNEKERLISTYRAHLDICSCSMLENVDELMCKYDQIVIDTLDKLMVGHEWVNKLRLTDENYKNSYSTILLNDFFYAWNGPSFFKKFVPPKAYDYLFRHDSILFIKGIGGTKKYKDKVNHSFWMADTPVSKKQWKLVLGEKKSDFRWGTEYHPVVNVSKEEINDFILILRKITGLYFDLPSKKEWIYAAKYIAGYEAYSKSKEEIEKMSDEDKNIEKRKKYKLKAKIEKDACTKDNKFLWIKERTMPFHTKKWRKNSSAIKLYDLLGGVWEWTRTSEDENTRYYFCGGSWRFKKLECNLKGTYWNAYRKPIMKSDDLGFRLVWKCDFNEGEIYNEPQEAEKQLSVVAASYTIQRAISSTDFFCWASIYRMKLIDFFNEVLTNRKKKLHNKNIVAKKIQGWFKTHRMVTLPEGYFIMGTERAIDAQKDWENEATFKARKAYWKTSINTIAGEEETPHHFVKISQFSICSVPVTQELWNVVMGTNAKNNPSKEGTNDDYPQTNISYIEIKEFFQKLNKIMREQNLINDNEEFRLPTEAEWEYASKYGESSKEIFRILSEELSSNKSAQEKWISIYNKLKGNSYPLYSGEVEEAGKVAWFEQATIHPVATKAGNPICISDTDTISIFDMSGNIWEWCWDYYQSDIYKDCILGTGCIKERLYSNEYQEQGYITDPICDSKEYSAHVFRGGSWNSLEKDCRCTRANYWIDTHSSNDLGFRLVKGYKIEKRLNELKGL